MLLNCNASLLPYGIYTTVTGNRLADESFMIAQFALMNSWVLNLFDNRFKMPDPL